MIKASAVGDQRVTVHREDTGAQECKIEDTTQTRGILVHKKRMA